MLSTNPRVAALCNVSNLLASSAARFPSTNDSFCHLLHALLVSDRGEQRGSAFAHDGSVPAHDVERCTDVRCQVGLSVSCGALMKVVAGSGLTLLTMRRSDCEMPGPPFLGILSPPETSIT